MSDTDPARQPAEVIDRARAALDVAREARDDAAYRHDAAAHALAYAVLRDFTPDEEWKEQYRATRHALDEASKAHHAARVAWYHAMGKHASNNLALCCQPQDDTTPA